MATTPEQENITNQIQPSAKITPDVVPPQVIKDSIYQPVNPADTALMPNLNQGKEALEPLKREDASFTESFKAGFNKTFISQALHAGDFSEYEPEEKYDPLKEFATTGDNNYNTGSLSEEDLDFLFKAQSHPEFIARQDALNKTSKDDQAIADNPIAGLGGMLLDIDTIAPLGAGFAAKAFKLGRAAEAITNLAIQGAVVGRALQGGQADPMAAVLLAAGNAMAVPSYLRKSKQLAQEAETFNRAEGVVQDITPEDILKDKVPYEQFDDVFDTEQELTRTYAPDIAEEQAETLRAQKLKESAVDDSMVVDNDSYIKEPRLVTEAEKVYTDTPLIDGVGAQVRDMIGAIIHKRADLSDEAKVLARSLYDSFEGEASIHVVFGAGKELGEGVEGSYKTMLIRNTKGISGIVNLRTASGYGESLSSVVSKMSKQEVEIALHEATHARTTNTMHAVEKGWIKEGVAYDATKNLGKIREKFAKHLNKNGVKDSDLQYAASSDREFVAQVFGSQTVRDYLKANKFVESEKKNFFRQVVDAISRILTGKQRVNTNLKPITDYIEQIMDTPVYWKADEAEQITDKMITTTGSNISDIVTESGDSLRTSAKKTVEWINRKMSLYDKLAQPSQEMKALTERLIIDGSGSEANSAAHFSRQMLMDSEARSLSIQNKIVEGVHKRHGWSKIKAALHPVKYKEDVKKFTDEVYSQLSENHAAWSDGRQVVPHSDPLIEDTIQHYANTEWAQNWVKQLEDSGWEFPDIIKSPYYLPREHNYNLMLNKMSELGITTKDVSKVYAKAFNRLYPELTEKEANTLGKEMFNGIQRDALRTRDWSVDINPESSVKSFVQDAIDRGDFLDAIELRKIVATIDKVENQSTGARNFRIRNAFDIVEPINIENTSGQLVTVRMADFINKDIAGLMAGYNRRMSGKYGLGKAGFKNMTDVKNEVDKALKTVSDNVDDISDTMNSTMNALMGHQIGERTPDLLRNLGTIASATQLVNSGILQLTDMATAAYRFGAVKTMKAAWKNKSIKASVELLKNPATAKRFEDIMNLRNLQSGMFRPLLTHTEDNFRLDAMDGITHYIQHYGQATHIVNGLEFVRRRQAQTITSLMANELENAVKKGKEFGKSKKLLNYFGFNDELIDDIRDAGGLDNFENWSDALKSEALTKGQNMMDMFVQENRLGELGAWSQFSSVSKAIFPYMNFVFGSWNKVLRKTYKDGGTLGVTLLALYQLPLSMLTTVASYANSGKDMDIESIAVKTISNLPIMSLFGYLIDGIYGDFKGNVTALSFADSVVNIMKKAATGEAPNADDVIRVTPLLSIMPAMRVAGKNISE